MLCKLTGWNRLLRLGSRDRADQLVFYSKLPRGYKPGQEKTGQEKIGQSKIGQSFFKYIFLVVPATTFGLGVWQYNRRDWKIKKIKELEFKVKQSPTQPLQEPDCEQEEYSRIRVKGTFDNTREIFIGPRSLLDTAGGTSGGIISSGEKVGWHVIAPFITESGQSILVNRGWVPRSRLDPDLRKDGQINGPVEIVGILRFNEETSPFTPPNKVETNSWFSRDINALAAKLNTKQVFLDLDAESSRYAADRGGPVGGQTRISLRNEHVQYMLTWWGISLATLFLWSKRFIF